MVEQRSRLQLLDELRKLDRAHIEATVDRDDTSDATCAGADAVFERYSYAELLILIDYLTVDTARLRG